MNSIEEGEMKRRLTLLEPLGDEEEEDEMSQGEEAEGQNGEHGQVSGDCVMLPYCPRSFMRGC